MSYSNAPLRIKLTDLAGIIGGLFITYYGVGYLMEKFPVRFRTPDSPALPPGAMPGSPPGLPAARPQLMTGPSLSLVPGRRYGVALDTTSLLPTSESSVKKKAVELGFNNVDVYDKPPPGWPGNTGKSKADTWVVAFYAGAPKQFPRVNDTPAGSIDVIEAWEG